eukprot:2815461-Pleurochrysis_carterae.AAC.1
MSISLHTCALDVILSAATAGWMHILMQDLLRGARAAPPRSHTVQLHVPYDANDTTCHACGW